MPAISQTSTFARGRQILLSGALAMGLIGGLQAGPASAQGRNQSPPSRGFDYWQPDWMVRELWGPGRMPKDMMTRMLRHMTYMNYGVPKEYDGAKSSVMVGPETTAAGGALYGTHCAKCHGKDGLGEGDGGKALSPSPALLAYMIRRPISVDEYLLWSISEGGVDFNSAMPSFKATLKPDEIWKIVAYMRAGFPDLPSAGETKPPAKSK